ncbi:mannonate dehydratase [Paenibacillus sp. J5C_2022]|uniref:mannonate dehydratase n=1 Tax=Paenibacillus sp. J5C2022 TaxID=2977129 RepID=UPI0021D1F16B|nr:mannonate dehydratase [Paenibacillus sp. J5C2022]MCU6708925.1 mannonate dehydratase [Paenibacillus sp. J5C2022]
MAIGQFNKLDEVTLAYGRQLGVTGVQLNTPLLPGQGCWELADLLELKHAVERYGLRLEALENVPLSSYNKAILGLEGRDEQIERLQMTIRNMGRAGIPVWGYHFMPNGVWRTSFSSPGRGGAWVSSFDLSKVEPELPRSAAGNAVADGNEEVRRLIESGPLEIISEERMWQNYEYFIKAIIPVAEESGVKLALHPDDPPVKMLGGVSRIFRSKESFVRAMNMASSDAWGIDLCCGSCSSMDGGANTVKEFISYFGPLGKIAYVHLRDVRGTVPKFEECFLGEGNCNVKEIIQLLKDTGFDGFILDDHVPMIAGDTQWGHRARGHAIGYIQGLIASAL